jgi:hypothetical protein
VCVCVCVREDRGNQSPIEFKEKYSNTGCRRVIFARETHHFVQKKI